ncbi:MAG: hypothetical protein RLZZ546_2733 [Bacteroidota bacterium]
MKTKISILVLLFFASAIIIFQSCSKEENISEIKLSNTTEIADSRESSSQRDCCDSLFISESIVSSKPGGCCIKAVKFTNNSNCSMIVKGLNTSLVLPAQSNQTKQVKVCPGNIVYFEVLTADSTLCRKYPVHSCEQSYLCPTGGVNLQWSNFVRPEGVYCTNVQVNIESLKNNYKNCRIKKVIFNYNSIVNNVRTPIFNTHTYELGVTPNLTAINQSFFPNDDLVPNNVTTNVLGDGDNFVLEHLGTTWGYFTLEVCYTIILDCNECPPITGCKTYEIACI